MKSLSILKLGEHGSNKRVWIANRNILKSGFQVGDSIKVDYQPSTNQIEITPTKGLGHTVSGRSESQPIIDVKNSQVAEVLGRPDKIEVRFYEKRIVISVAKTEQRKVERTHKNSRQFFELFCGGGTLHHFFKKAGFSSAGGLELEDKYLAVFDQNNPSHDTLTICSAIEDVCPSDYPRGVELVVAGIPCTSFTKANLKMTQELQKRDKNEDADPNTLADRYSAEALVFHVLRAIEAMNPKTVVIEEVTEFADHHSAMLLRTVLKQWGYQLSEAIGEGMHTKRKRWCMVANMEQAIDLSGLPDNDGRTIGEVIDFNQRHWMRLEESNRLTRANNTIGLRVHEPTELKINTITTHSTRSTEPALKIPGQNLYSELTIEDIKKTTRVRGLQDTGNGYPGPPNLRARCRRLF